MTASPQNPSKAWNAPLPKAFYTYFIFLTFGILGCCVYSPSLFHVPRADHIFYLAETAGREGWPSLALDAYDLNRTRSFCPGDELLFRPLFYVWLGTARYLFGYSFELWQAAGIFLHLLTVWCLWRLLRKIRGGVFASMFAAFFLVLTLNNEMVVWAHVQGYMLWMALTLAALGQYYSIIQEKYGRPWRAVWLVLLLGTADFFYEFGLGVAVILFCDLTARSREVRVPLGVRLGILFPVALYVLWSLGNLLLTTSGQWSTPGTAYKISAVIPNLIKSNYWWVTQGLFTPDLQFVWDGGRLSFLVSKNLLHLLGGYSSLLYSAAWIAVGGMGVLFLESRRHRGPMRSGRVWGVFAILIIGYSAAVVLGRINFYNVDFLMRRSYYGYFFWAFFLVFMYSLTDPDDSRAHQRGWRILTAAAVSLLIIGNAGLTFATNLRQARESREERRLLQTVESFVAGHPQNRPFSFFVPDGYPGNSGLPPV
ncbi:MAG: hypothetical protein U1D99_02040, partial [Candidatus Omnitrophota bacterium]|nr:hypothetical protein [Candidatus Omnitrophota bacterium]